MMPIRSKLGAMKLSAFPLVTSAIVISSFALAALQAASKSRKDLYNSEVESQSWSQMAAAGLTQAPDAFSVADLQETPGRWGENSVFSEDDVQGNDPSK
jgi:hypothetical protein